MAYPGGERTKKSSNASDVELDVATEVSKTLQDVARASPIPALKQSASLTLEITTTVQTAKGNKGKFEVLATDARELVFVICCAAQNVGSEGDVSLDLMDYLDRVLNLLIQIKEFAEKCSSRKMFSALFRTKTDAEQIQSYRQMLQEFASEFGIDINLKVKVHKLVAQGKMPEPESPTNRIGVERNGDTAPASPNSSSNLNSTSRSTIISPTIGDVEPNETSSSDARTGSWAVDDASSANVNGGAGHDKPWVKNDNSVHLGEGVSFAGAYGFNFGGSPSVTWNINKTS